jgi:branched-subunit amino acid transport protein
MNYNYLLIGVILMALVTYVLRVSPLVLFRKKIENKTLQSFLHYVPYTVLAAMTFPAIFSSTESTVAAVAGCLVGIGLAYFKRGLVTVAVGAASTVFILSMLGL